MWPLVWQPCLHNAKTNRVIKTYRGVQNFGADAISIRLAVKTEPGEQWATGRLIRARLKKAFDINGIEIPFPQRTVWVNQVAERTSTAPGGTEIREDLLGQRSGSDGDD